MQKYVKINFDKKSSSKTIGGNVTSDIKFVCL